MRYNIQIRDSGSLADAGFQAGNGPEKIFVKNFRVRCGAAFPTRGHPDFAATKAESARHNRHQRARHAVENHRSAHNFRVGIELRFPDPIVHGENRRRIGFCVFFGDHAA